MLDNKERGDEWAVRAAGLALAKAAGMRLCPIPSGTSSPIGAARQKACRAAVRGPCRW